MAFPRPPLLTESAPGTLLYGGARMALLDIESGLWTLRRQLEALIGRSSADSLFQQAGANGGASFAAAFVGSAASGGGQPLGVTEATQALRDCVAAYQAAGFGRFEVTSLRWPIGRAVIRAADTVETWMARRHGDSYSSPACAYTAGVLVGFVNVIAGRRDVVCVERQCQANGADACVFELLPAGAALTARAVGVDPDPALSYQLNLLHILFDRMPMGIAVFDRKMTLRRFNPTWAEFVSRYTPKAPPVVPGLSIRALVPGSEATWVPLFRRALGGETVSRNAFRTESGGVVSYWDTVLTPLTRGGEVVGIVDVTTDATERVLAYQTLEQRVEERTREIEQKRAVAEGLRGILAVLNSNRPLTEILDFIVLKAGHLLGTDTVAVYRLDPETQLLTIQAARGLPGEYVAHARIPVGQGAVGNAVLRREPLALPLTKDGPSIFDPGLDPETRAYLTDFRGRFSSVLAVPLVIKDEVYGGLVLYYADQREFSAEDTRLAATFGDQVALAIENARLRARAEQAAVAAERNRLARDLHDAVTQTLFSASLIADVLPRLWERDQAQGRIRLEELRQLTRGALAEMRTLLLELRPAALVEAGLGDVLRHLCEAIAGRSRVPVRLTVTGQRLLPPEVQVALYRIAQEALNNVAKHSRATTAEVAVVFGPDRVELTVRDDGRGFDASAVPPDHLGLGIMKERASAVGASLRVVSSPGQGTVVSVVWEDVGSSPQPRAGGQQE